MTTVTKSVRGKAYAGTKKAKALRAVRVLSDEEMKRRSIFTKRELQVMATAVSGIAPGLGWSRREVADAKSAHRKLEAVLARFGGA